jgi:hypothetical protein
MWEDWNSLRNDLRKLTGKNGVAIWTTKGSDFVFHLAELNKLHDIMGEDLEML